MRLYFPSPLLSQQPEARFRFLQLWMSLQLPPLLLRFLSHLHVLSHIPLQHPPCCPTHLLSHPEHHDTDRHSNPTSSAVHLQGSVQGIFRFGLPAGADCPDSNCNHSDCPASLSFPY